MPVPFVVDVGPAEVLEKRDPVRSSLLGRIEDEVALDPLGIDSADSARPIRRWTKGVIRSVDPLSNEEHSDLVQLGTGLVGVWGSPVTGRARDLIH